jgi:hypothetical protein
VAHFEHDLSVAKLDLCLMCLSCFRDSVVAHFEHDLSVAMTEVDVEEKHRRLQKLYEKHCGQRQKRPEEEVGPEALVEMQRQR